MQCVACTGCAPQLLAISVDPKVDRYDTTGSQFIFNRRILLTLFRTVIYPLLVKNYFLLDVCVNCLG